MLFRILIGAVLSACAAAACAQAGGVHVELNKLQPVDNACRAYLVTQNLTKDAFDSLKLDVVMFDDSGIVAKRLAVQIGPMPAGKTSLKVFDIDGLTCAKIGQLLLNGVLECTSTPAAAPAADDQTAAADMKPQSRNDCLSLLTVSQRGQVPFIE